MDAILEWVWVEMNRRINVLRGEVAVNLARSERSEVAGGADEIAFTDLPVLADGATNGDLYWCTDCRKTGEGVGAGTGVLVYYDETTTAWKRISDDVNAAI